ncbi:MAG: hypothetical protein Q9186_005161 [Xanthomendoza sp. 1 TL-2023]
MSSMGPGAIKNVAVIGAGPSGLATAKFLLAENPSLDVVVYEQRKNVGGVWNYTPLNPHRQLAMIEGTIDEAIDAVTANLPDLNTPMYENLETNLPHMLMQFSDAPFPAGTQLFPSRQVVLQYLQEYANDIMPLIRFDHEVVDVRPKSSKQMTGWEVTVEDVKRLKKVESFDAVAVASGHCDWPLLPAIEGLDAWSRQFPESLHHSVSYKNAETFVDKRILLVGGGPSGADIGNQIAAKCKHPVLVAQTSKSPYHTDQPCMREYPGLVELIPEERAAKFADGNIEKDIDHIVLCTGYAYRFPFLTSLHPDIKNMGIQALPLYQHIFHINHPTLAFIEIPEMIVPFPLAECQAAVAARVWSGRLELPDEREMEEWRASVHRERGRGRCFHALQPPLDLQYMKAMYEWSSKTEGQGIRDHNGREKMPSRWDEKSSWLRMAAAEMKKAFNARGDQRCEVKRYEELASSPMPAPISIILLASLSSLLPPTLAQQNKTTICHSNTQFGPDGTTYNASATYPIPAFIPPNDPTEPHNWTYHTAILVNTKSSMQTLWIDDPASTSNNDTKITSKSLPYIGCLVAFFGLPHDTVMRGQEDTGDCTKTFDQECVNAVLAGAKEAGALVSGTMGNDTATSGKDAGDVCAQLMRTAVPGACRK